MADRVRGMLRRGFLSGEILGLVLCAPVALLGEGSAGVVVHQSPSRLLRTVKLQEYKSQLQHARELVAACGTDPPGCDAGQVGEDDRVSDGGFDVHWEWLRSTLDAAKKGKAEDRGKVLQEASARLDEEAGDAGLEARAAEGGAGGGVDFGKARAGANEVLARGEFRRVTEQDLWERAFAWLARWIGRMFSGVATLGSNAPWLGVVLEWGFCLLAAATALVWAQRAMQRQRLMIRMSDDAAPVREWDEASRRWSESAAAAAENGDWREAVHTLYWASVVELEGRKVWRQNRGRTPREYLRMLEPSSRFHAPVRAMTQLLERIWYGLRAAERGDYERARALYEEVRAA